jgi:hypothetical protein
LDTSYNRFQLCLIKGEENFYDFIIESAIKKTVTFFSISFSYSMRRIRCSSSRNLSLSSVKDVAVGETPSRF